MFSNFLIKKFVKNYSDVRNESVREQYGILGGTVGILLNLVLFSIKLAIGIAARSISATADAFNNLSDVLSSIITIAGFKIAAKPADREHPFGHGRFEYISALAVSFMILLVGIEFIKSSFDKIANPVTVKSGIISLFLILLSIAAKVWISNFNKILGTRINSESLKASSLDALTDVITSSCIVISLVAGRFTTFPVDGCLGFVVSGFIIYSGINILKSTINPLLGEPPDPKLVKNIVESVKSYEYICGVHDLIIHNYGPGKYMATIHAEVPCNVSIVKIHESIDNAEREISEKLNIILVIHMDPINTDDAEIQKTKKEISVILKPLDFITSIHDFRMIGETSHRNLVFDVVVNSAKCPKNLSKSDIREIINGEIKKYHPYYNSVVTIDRNYTDI